jgi:branched-chain amino acid transport system substrate-binding protein
MLAIAGAAVHVLPAFADSQGVRLGFVTNLSGPGSLFGEPALQGVQLAVDEINQAGGVLGGPLSLQVFDDATDPNMAKQGWDKLIGDGVDAILSEETSASRAAALASAEKANVPVLYAVDYEGGACSPVMYLNGAIDAQKAPSFIDFLMQQSGGNKFFMLGTDYNWARGAFAITKEAIGKAGGVVVGEEYMPFNTPDYSALIKKIRDSGADILFLGLVGGPDNVAFFKQARGAGVRMTPGNLTAGSLSLDDGTLKAVGSAAEGTYMTTGYFSSIDTPGNKKFLAALKAKFGDDMKLQSFLSQASYDAAHLYALAVNKAGTTDTAAVLKALSEVQFEGPRGPIAMTTDRHATLTIYIAQADAEGLFDVVKSLPDQVPPDQCDPDPPFGMK